MTLQSPRYVYGPDKEGVNDLFIIQDTKTGRDIACTLYWDCDPAWAKRAERNAVLIVKALNAYATSPKRTKSSSGKLS